MGDLGNPARITKGDWDKLGPTALSQEIYTFLNNVVIPEATTTTTAAAGTTTSNVFNVTVTGGSGADYTVSLDTGEDVSVTVPGILLAATIPAGTVWFAILGSDGEYTMPCPLWLA